MDPNPNEIVRKFPRLFRVYKDGCMERFTGIETTPAGTYTQTGTQSKDVVINPEIGVSAHLFLPKSAHKLPLLIYIHGGAFCIGTSFNTVYHKHLTDLVAEANVVALSVHYRLAPEHPLPIAYDDSWAVIQWAVSHAKGNGPEPWLNDHVDFKRVFLAGDSAGANLAHNMTMLVEAGNTDGLKLNDLALIHPFFGNGEQDNLIEYLFPTMDRSADPRIHAAKDPKLWSLGCRKVLIQVAGNDYLKDRAWSYYEALKNSGWNGVVNIDETEGVDHMFHLFNPRADKSVALVKSLASFINPKSNI